MPYLDHETAIKQYWDSVKDQYPNIDYEDFAKICRSPFRAIREWIRSDEIFSLRVKYLGTFKVFSSTVNRIMLKLQGMFDAGIYSEETYLSKKEKIDQYLKELKAYEDGTEIELTDDTYEN